MISIQELLAGMRLGDPTGFQHLTLFPMFRLKPARPEPGYLLLEEAMERGVARVTEVSHGGSVPELQFENSAPLPVLLLDGEELVGAKQNRVLNLSILAPARSAIKIPVSCVEAGRWQNVSAQFRAADAVQYASAREARARQVSKSIREEGHRRSDQNQVWQDIALKAGRLRTTSGTGAMRAMFEQHRDSVEHYLRAFAWAPGQTGVLYCIGGQRWGIDLFDHAASFERVFPRLLRGYALDAIDTEPSTVRPVSSDRLGSFVRAVVKAPAFAVPAVGLGKDVRIAGAKACGGALWAEDRYVHLYAFSSQAEGSGQAGSGIARPSRRRG